MFLPEGLIDSMAPPTVPAASASIIMQKFFPLLTLRIRFSMKNLGRTVPTKSAVIFLPTQVSKFNNQVGGMIVRKSGKASGKAEVSYQDLFDSIAIGGALKRCFGLLPALNKKL